jgi:cystathionine beta-synthase
MKCNSILDTMGNTPLIRLNRVAKDVPAEVWVKADYLNPGGSVKDRIGVTMIDEAERKGLLKPGGTIIEGTSGNTGMGLALVAAVRGYKVVFTITDKQSREKVDLLKAFGAEVIVCPTAVEPEDPRSYYSVAKKLAREIPNAFYPNQYENPMNPEAHYRTTGPEIWKDTEGKITHFVAGMGTGGTISGVAKYLKEKNPKVRVIGADPVGSILKAYQETGKITEAHTYKIEGVGEDFIPGATDFSLIDQVIACNDRNGLNTARRLAREEAIFVGGSSGMAAWVAIEVARGLTDNDLVVVLLPDTGERYLSKVHSDAWMRDNHLFDPSITRVSEVLDGKGRAVRGLLSVQASEPLRKALSLVEQHDITQIPVFRAGQVVGTLYDNEILKRVLENSSALDQPVESLMSEALPVVESDDSVESVTRLMAARNSAVLVRDHGVLTGILSRYDMLQFIAGGEG